MLYEAVVKEKLIELIESHNKKHWEYIAKKYPKVDKHLGKIEDDGQLEKYYDYLSEDILKMLLKK